MPPGPRIAPPQRATDRPQVASHVTTVGVRRPAWGQAGRGITVATNHFEVRVPQDIIHHYDGTPLVDTRYPHSPFSLYL